MSPRLNKYCALARFIMNVLRSVAAIIAPNAVHVIVDWAQVLELLEYTSTAT